MAFAWRTAYKFCFLLEVEIVEVLGEPANFRFFLSLKPYWKS